MRRRALAIGLTLVLGCAVGVNETGDVEEGGADTTGVTGGAGGSDGSSTGSSSTGGMGGTMGTGGTGGAGGGMGSCVFDHVETCQTAENLGGLPGDEDEPPITRFGTSSRWFQVQIREEVGSILQERLSYTVTLTSAAGMDYDLIIHQGGQDDPPNCSAAPKMGVDQGGGVESIHDDWDDDQGLGGEDDHVWLSIEVRHVSGDDCATSGEWTLEIEGHT